jgi:ribose 5-phosphate isomerase A
LDQDQLKRQVGEAALEWVREGCVLGVGTGSTVNKFIEALADSGKRIESAVSSSEASTRLLQKIGVEVIDLNHSGTLDTYIDGADECDEHRRLIKGGGGALTREKVLAAAARKFICVIDDSKMVGSLGTFPLPVEVIPMARSYVARQFIKARAQPVAREGFLTDNGNQILDVWRLNITNPAEMEDRFNRIPGVVTVGIFAHRGADVILLADNQQVRVLEK